LGMMAVHIFPVEDADGTASVAWQYFGGRSAALFALLAGVSLAFLAGGRRPVSGLARQAASLSIAVRAGLIGLVGLALGYATEDASVILAYYAVLFLLAIPLLGLSVRKLVWVAVGAAILGPLLMQTVRDWLPAPVETNLTFHSLGDPLGLLSMLLVTGVYPALPWMAYIGAGLAIGRLLRASTRLAARLLCGGLALAFASALASSVLVHRLGGLEQIRQLTPDVSGRAINDVLVWGPDPELPTTTWWWLAIDAPHSSTPLDLFTTLGVAMAVLGAMLLTSRVAARVQRPFAAAGSMTLTLYSAHLVVLGSGFLRDLPYISFVVQVAAVLVFAVVWRATHDQGPLEKVVAAVAGKARAHVLAAGRQDRAPQPVS
jgi:hypothetical protein